MIIKTKSDAFLSSLLFPALFHGCVKWPQPIKKNLHYTPIYWILTDLKLELELLTFITITVLVLL